METYSRPVKHLSVQSRLSAVTNSHSFCFVEFELVFPLGFFPPPFLTYFFLSNKCSIFFKAMLFREFSSRRFFRERAVCRNSNPFFAYMKGLCECVCVCMCMCSSVHPFFPSPSLLHLPFGWFTSDPSHKLFPGRMNEKLKLHGLLKNLKGR